MAAAPGSRYAFVNEKQDERLFRFEGVGIARVGVSIGDDAYADLEQHSRRR